MKAFKFGLLIVLAGVMLLPGSGAGSPARAAPGSAQPPAAAQGDGLEVFLSLPVEPPSPDVPAGLTPQKALEYARRLTQQQAEPLLAELRALRARGVVTAFEVSTGLHGIVVHLAEGGRGLDELARLPGLSAVMPRQDAVSCGRSAVDAMQRQLLAASQARAVRDAGVGAAPQATNPSIDVYHYPDNSYGEISGYAAGNTTVTLRIYRADGSPRVTQTGTSYGDGWYDFYPSYHSCPSSGYDWVPHTGDTVEVSAAGNTASTVVAPISVWADPVADVVAGVTAPGRSVLVEAHYPAGSPCQWASSSVTVGTDAGGSFSASFVGTADLDRSSWAYAYARDPNGNSTYLFAYAYSLHTNFYDGQNFSGYLKPGVSFTADLKRGGSTISTVAGTTESYGYFYGDFGQPMQPGDVVEVTGGGVAVSMTVAGLSNLGLDPAANSVSGTTAPGRRVEADFYTAYYWPSYNGCSWNYDCASATADGSGHFGLAAGFDWKRGDVVYLYIYDEQGNYQYTGELYAPLIIADSHGWAVDGTWPEPGVHLYGTLRDSGGTVKGTGETWAYGDFSLYLGAQMLPGDQVEVTDGITPRSTTVSDVTARVNSDADTIYGHTPGGRLTVYFYNQDLDNGWQYEYCHELSVGPGDYSLNVSGDANLNASSWANVYFTGGDGHKTHASGHAFWVFSQKDAQHVSGYTVEPSTAVSVTLRDGDGNVKGIGGGASEGQYGFFFVTVPATILSGDRLDVTAGGWSAQVPIPDLTANLDPPGNRVYGRAVPDEIVYLMLLHRDKWSHSEYFYHTRADASGDYSYALAGYWPYNCSPVQAGDRCAQAMASYYNGQGHEVDVHGAPPPDAAPDAYESDDTYGQASIYSGPQSHTFDEDPDDDWVKLTVPAEDVADGIVYRFSTYNLGWHMATRVRLYRPDGTTLIWDYTADEDWGRGLTQDWMPATPGDYYLDVSSPGYQYTGYCDAVYDLRILPLRDVVYLPVITRSYEK